MNELRERLCDAMLALGPEQGLPQTSIQEVAERAGLTRPDFDRVFASKEDCAIAVFDRSMRSFRATVLPVYESQGEWPDSLRAAAYASARWIAEHPRDTRFGAFELLSVGELAQVSRDAAFQSFVDLIDAGRQYAPDPDSVPARAAEGVMGSLAGMITKRARQGPLEPYEFVPQVMYLAVLPYLGEEIASRELTIPPPGRGEDAAEQ
jgi:AcrR family transcriptional regulator